MAKPLPVPTKLVFVALIAVLAIVDQISKWWIVEMHFRPRIFEADGKTMEFFPWLLTLGQSRMPGGRTEITPYFDLVMAWNTGVSFSMLSSDHDWMPLVLIIMAVALSLVFIVWLLTTNSRWTAFPLALIIAGALSNVWDRTRFGAVVDFLYFHIGKYDWPAFNIADSCIVVGVALLAYDSLFLEPKRKKGYAP